MWLSAISNRTPQAYFAFTTGTALLLAAAAWPGSLPSGGWQETSMFAIPPLALLIFAFLANRMLVIADALSKNTLWAGHAYAASLLLYLPDIRWEEALVHGLAALLVFYQMVTLAYNQDARRHAFNAALFLGASSLLHSPVLLMVPFALLGLRQLNPLRPREYLLFLLGLALPYYFAWSYGFLTGDYGLWHRLAEATSWFRVAGLDSWREWARWGLTALMAAMLTVYLFGKFNNLPVRLRRLTSAMVYLLMGSLLVALAGGFPAYALLYAAPALGLLATLAMLRYTNKYALEIIHLIFMAIIIGLVLTGPG